MNYPTRTATDSRCQNSVTPTLTYTDQVDESVPHTCFYTHLFILAFYTYFLNNHRFGCHLHGVDELCELYLLGT